MDWVVVEGVRPYDGRYPFDLENNEFTVREWGWIKRLSGYMPATIADGFQGADPELIACFALIAMRRAGKIQDAELKAVFERIADTPFDGATIRVESEPDTVEEEDADPPTSRSSSGNEPTSGGASMTSSASSEATRNGSGIHASDASPFDQPTWAN